MRYRVNSLESFSIIARRLGTACVWRDLEAEFCKSSSTLCEIFYEAIEYLHTTHGHLIEDFKYEFIIPRAEEYGRKVFESGASLDSFVGFVDGTNIFIARPKGEMQREAYNGHKKRHSVKFQALTLPVGVIMSLYGPFEGRRHDLTLFRESNLGDHLSEHMSIGGWQFYVYADSTYQIQQYMMVGYRGPGLTNEQKKFNKEMSKARITVEWTFKEVEKHFTHVDFTRKMNVSKTPVGLWYYASCLILNFRTYLNGSQASRYFDCRPPSLTEYMSLPNSSD